MADILPQIPFIDLSDTEGPAGPSFLFLFIACIIFFVNKKRKRRKHTKAYRRKLNKRAFHILVSVVIIACVGLTAGLVFSYQDHQETIEETPVKSTLKLNDYNWTKLTLKDGRASYSDDLYTSQQGIDVSDHQKYINWKKVKNDGIQFAFIRCGYRGYSTGGIRADAYFENNIREAKKNGIKVGVYFFSQAVSVEEAREEAQFTLKQIKNYDLDLPVVFDMEQAGNGKGRVDHLSREIWTQNAVTFCHIMQNHGYQAMVYNSTNLFEKLFVPEYLQEFDTWIAQYDVSYPTYPYTFSCWQYSSTGKVDGIDVDTDMDIRFVAKEK